MQKSPLASRKVLSRNNSTVVEAFISAERFIELRVDEKKRKKKKKPNRKSAIYRANARDRRLFLDEIANLLIDALRACRRRHRKKRNANRSARISRNIRRAIAPFQRAITRPRRRRRRRCRHERDRDFNEREMFAPHFVTRW